jgi:DNA-binding XRE family transcriptional regulator
MASHCWQYARMNENLNKLIAKRFKFLMESTPALDTQKKLEHRSGVGQSTIGRIVRAATDPQIGTLADIASAFRKPVTYLFDDAVEQKAGVSGVGEPSPGYSVTVDAAGNKKISRRQLALLKTLVSGFESGGLDDRDADAVQSFLAGRMSAR